MSILLFKFNLNILTSDLDQKQIDELVITH